MKLVEAVDCLLENLFSVSQVKKRVYELAIHSIHPIVYLFSLWGRAEWPLTKSYHSGQVHFTNRANLERTSNACPEFRVATKTHGDWRSPVLNAQNTKIANTKRHGLGLFQVITSGLIWTLETTQSKAVIKKETRQETKPRKRLNRSFTTETFNVKEQTGAHSLPQIRAFYYHA